MFRALAALLAVLAASPAAIASERAPVLPRTERELAELPPEVQNEARRYLALEREVEGVVDAEEWA
jgi:hypothetical protein